MGKNKKGRNKEYGAYNITLGIYQSAICADKSHKYKCIDAKCDEPVFLKQGEMKIPHFCHHKGTKCNILNGGGEGITHKEAKRLLERFLNEGNKIYITRKCCGSFCGECPNKRKIHKEAMLLKDNKLKSEYKIDFNNEDKYLDLAQINSKNEVIEFYEIYDTHKIKENERPSYLNWYEFTANNIKSGIIEMTNENSNILKLTCTRVYRCEDCTFMNDEIIKAKQKLKEKDFYKRCYRGKAELRRNVERALIELARAEDCYIKCIWDAIKKDSLQLDIKGILAPIKYLPIIKLFLPKHKLINT